MLLAVITGTAVSFACIAFSVFMAYHVKEIAANAYLSIAAGADSGLMQAFNNVNVDLSWMAWQWVIVWLVIFACLFFPVTLSIKKIITPLRAVANYADSLAKGDVYIEVVKNRQDEIGLIQENFHKLVEANRRQAEVIRRISEGDLTAEAAIMSEKDVIGLSLTKMINSLNTLFAEIDASATQVSSGAKQIADGAQSLAQGATEQAASVEQLSSSISEINRMAKENSENATQAFEEVQKAGQEMGVCAEQMRQMLTAMKTINDKSKDILKTTKVIDDIAFQTNILALNAAVEAARAGQHGKGFAVVAEEVRNLASKSAEAAKETASLLESSTQSVEEGNRIVERVNSSLQSVIEIAQMNAEHITKVQSISVNQSNSMTQVTVGIDQVAQVVQQSSATSEESAAASAEMSGQSALLKELILQFKLKDGDIRTNLQISGNPHAKHLGAPGNTNAVQADGNDYGKY